MATAIATDSATSSGPTSPADIRAGIRFAERFELYGRITNLFDERYETASFYGAPGRQAFVGIRAKL